ATKVASHQDTHTYRLSNLLKISAAPFRSIRQQQRSEIMKHSQLLVKQFRKIFFNISKLPDPSAPLKNRRRRRGAHYRPYPDVVNRRLRIFKWRQECRGQRRITPILPHI
ncbi:MAG: hypothetical protein ACK4FP_03275, partial [Azonexus sp.]